jgi:hypothetical protein
MVYGLLRDRIELLFKGHTRGNHLDFFQKASEKPFSTRSELGFFCEGHKRDIRGTERGQNRDTSGTLPESLPFEWRVYDSGMFDSVIQGAEQTSPGGGLLKR